MKDATSGYLPAGASALGKDVEYVLEGYLGKSKQARWSCTRKWRELYELSVSVLDWYITIRGPSEFVMKWGTNPLAHYFLNS
jgi:hypothetical protein